MASILVVCTGNVCRSPLAEAFLRQALVARFPHGAPDVASAGTAGWEGSPAHPDSVAVAKERDVDISTHVARRLNRPMVDDADLVLAMAGEHRDGVVHSVPQALGRTFTLKELVRLLDALPPAEFSPSFDLGALRRRVGEAADLRAGGFEGSPYDEDVSDPLGLPPETFRAVAWDLEEWCDRLLQGMFGKVPARASIWDDDE
jgi:protein-tyrosine phosphatase